MSGVEVNKRCDIFPSAVIINRVSVVCGIQKELFNTEFREVCFHCEKGMEKGKHVMPGSPFQKWKYREVAIGIGSHIHVEVVAEEIAFPVGVPSPVTVRLGVMTLTVTGRTAFFFTIADTLFPLLGGSTDRRAVTSKGQMAWGDQPIVDRKVQELLFIELENKGEGIFWFQLPAFQEGEEFGSRTGRVAGGLIPFLFPFGRFHFRETVFGRGVVLILLPNAGKEVIKSPDPGRIAEREAAGDGIKGSFLKHAAPDSDGSYFQFQGEKVGAQHTGREPGLGAKGRIAFQHNRIRLGKIKIPELHDIIPGAFGKHKGVRIKF